MNPTASIFVFGANREGRHGKGSALEARLHHGAIYGQAEGLQGNSYAIVTKELRRGFLPVTLDEVQLGVEKFLEFAARHREWKFKVVAIGCSLAGFSPLQIGPMFRNRTDNVLIPAEFIQAIAGTYRQAEEFPRFVALKKAVESRRIAKKAFDDWYDARHPLNRPAQMPTAETCAEQAKLIHALGVAERDIVYAAEELI